MEPDQWHKSTVCVHQLVEIVALCLLSKISFAATNQLSDEKLSDRDVI